MALVDSVRAALAELEPLDVRDQPAADLALLYAQAIDDAAEARDDEESTGRGWQDKQRDPLAELGPKLLAVLVQLGCTPAARKNVIGDKPEPARKSPLDELRERRAARAT